MQTRFYSNGKLLVTGEYAVLDGATALAVPTVFGQALELSQGATGECHWYSHDTEGTIWFEVTFEAPSLRIRSTSDTTIAQRLQEVFRACGQLRPDFLASLSHGVTAHSHLGFDRHWGLGSSSTLINNLAQWAKVDPYRLLAMTFGGSGYDIACAQHNTPLHYRLTANGHVVQPAAFDPPFKNRLFFVYLNQKQNSREGIKAYRERGFDRSELISNINMLTTQLTTATTTEAFDQGLEAHEALLAKVMGVPTIKERLFADFAGSIKSLGAWGGDFVLASGNEKTPDYFKAKGFHTVLSYSEMVL
ncbi:GYDIA family GHMP kinase [Flagellimonas sp. DF-77]|uniref:GYDIA family GHMP kinase n=1 Tax=Flagellimonas algarum TaxID=3230298 RepID=UPI00339651D4